MGTKTAVAPIDALDDDLEAACADRHEAWRKLAIKENQANRDAYAEACAEVDALLDMRFEMQAGERRAKTGKREPVKSR